MTKVPLTVALGGMAAAALFLVGYTRGAAATAPSISAAATPSVPPALAELPESAQTKVEMENVNIHLDSALVLYIHYLYGQFVPTKKGQPVIFDDKKSYVVSIDSGEVGMSVDGMSHMLNTYVFNTSAAPMRNVKLSVQGDQIKQTGTLNKGPGIPFEMVGAMSVTPDGRVRIHPTQIKALHFPVKGLMKVIGLHLAKLMNTDAIKSVTVDGDDIILDPERMLPPPRMRGRITAVRIQGDQLVQTFGPPQTARPTKTFAGNYMYYRGGVLRFGKLTMNDTDMRLIDTDPSNPFDFYPDHYQRQLIAGYSKNTKAGGLLVYMPDYSKIESK